MFSSDDADDDDEVIIVSHSKPLPVAANTDGNHAANADSDSVTKFKSAPFYDLTCPICFDSPRPLVATNCGHALYIF